MYLKNINCSLCFLVKIRNKNFKVKSNKIILNKIKELYKIYRKVYNLVSFGYLIKYNYIAINDNNLLIINSSPSDFNELKTYFKNAEAGDTITLLPDTTYYGNLIIDNIHGDENNYISIIGNNTSTIFGSNVENSFVIKISNSSYIYFGLKPIIFNEYGKGYNLTNAQKGIYVSSCENIIIQNLNIYNIGYEALHLLNNTSYCKVLNNNIHDTGLYNPENGFSEGIYIGTSKSNWVIENDEAQPDETNNILISYNNLYNIISECVDIKEGTYNGTISYNTMNGSKLNDKNNANSWIDIKGEYWNILNNSMNVTLLDGIQTHFINDSVSNSGCNNTISGNIMNCITVNDTPCNGYAININSKTTGNIVYSNNIYQNAKEGLTNIEVTQI
jgi:hypothetical protein